MARKRTRTIIWKGPFGWPGHEGNLPPVPGHPGVYLQTFEYRKGYLVSNPGLTTRTIRKRLKEHTRNFMNGEYHVLSMPSIQKGARRLIWRGWDWSRGRRTAFNKRKSAILPAVHKQLAAYRIFVADLGANKRLLHRVEAAIMNHFYNHPNKTFRNIPDRNMHREGRWDSETPITTTNKCAHKLHGFPRRLVI